MGVRDNADTDGDSKEPLDGDSFADLLYNLAFNGQLFVLLLDNGFDLLDGIKIGAIWARNWIRTATLWYGSGAPNVARGGGSR